MDKTELEKQIEERTRLNEIQDIKKAVHTDWVKWIETNIPKPLCANLCDQCQHGDCLWYKWQERKKEIGL